MKILQTACDPSVSKDKSLPYSAFLVEYIEGDIHKFDLVISAKQSEIFDHYWDKYKKDFVNITQSDGRANPKLWNPNPPKEKK